MIVLQNSSFHITGFANDHPEFNSGGSNVEALSIAPGEGKWIYAAS